jgi:hypothetical protein
MRPSCWRRGPGRRPRNVGCSRRKGSLRATFAATACSEMASRPAPVRASTEAGSRTNGGSSGSHRLDVGPVLCYEYCSDEARHHRCTAVSGTFRRAGPCLCTIVRHHDAGPHNGLLGRLLREDEVVPFGATKTGSTERRESDSRRIELGDDCAGAARNRRIDVRRAASGA